MWEITLSDASDPVSALQFVSSGDVERHKTILLTEVYHLEGGREGGREKRETKEKERKEGAREKEKLIKIPQIGTNYGFHSYTANSVCWQDVNTMGTAAKGVLVRQLCSALRLNPRTILASAPSEDQGDTHTQNHIYHRRGNIHATVH